MGNKLKYRFLLTILSVCIIFGFTTTAFAANINIAGNDGISLVSHYNYAPLYWDFMGASQLDNESIKKLYIKTGDTPTMVLEIEFPSSLKLANYSRSNGDYSAWIWGSLGTVGLQSPLHFYAEFCYPGNEGNYYPDKRLCSSSATLVTRDKVRIEWKLTEEYIGMRVRGFEGDINHHKRCIGTISYKGDYNGQEILVNNYVAVYAVRENVQLIPQDAFNQPPTTPSHFNIPSGSEFAGANVWYAHGTSTDPDGDSITYQVDIRYRNTSNSWGSWSTVGSSSSNSGYHTISSSTSYNAFQMRVRASDGKGGYSSYREGNVVDITHNRAPVVSLNSPSSGYITGYNSITFSWTASDPDGDPVTSTLYVDGSNRGSVSGAGSKSLTVYGLSDGKHTWYVRASDGKTSTNSTSWNFTVDTTPPNISFSPSSRTWSPSNISVRVNVSDSLSGVATKRYAWSNSTSTPGNWATLGSSVNQTDNGVWYLHVRATDGMGNTETTYSGPYYKDDIKPTLTIGDPPTSWQNSDISVNIQHSDSGGSGVATKRYAVTNSTSKPNSGWTNLTSTNQNITISNDGQWYLHVQIIDGAGNETYQYKGPFKVDKTAPTVTITSPPVEWKNTNLTVNIQHNANVSGAAIKRYAVTDSTSKPGSGWTNLTSANQNITISENGAWYVHVQVIDNAGNETYKYSGPFKVDKTVPTGSFTVTDRTGLPKTITPEVRLNMNFSDTYSGLDKVEISTDNKTWSPKLAYQDYYDWVVDSKAGMQYVYVRVYDKAGNMAVYSSGIQIVEDITGPTVELIINNHAESTEVKNVNLTINASDDYSKVEKMRFSNNAIQWTPWEDYNQTKNGWDLTAETYGGSLEVGLKAVYVQVYDTFNNTSMSQASISYTAGGFKLEPGDVEFYSDSGKGGTYHGQEVRFVNEPTAQIKSNYSNVSQMQFTFDDWAWTPWEPYSMDKTVELQKFEGLTKVNAKARTSAGAISAKQDILFIVDMIKPTVTVKTLNNATATTTGSIELVVDVKDNISTTGFEYRINAGVFKSLPSNGKITVTGLTPGNFNEIKVEVKDQAGNIAEDKVSVWYLDN